MRLSTLAGAIGALALGSTNAAADKWEGRETISIEEITEEMKLFMGEDSTSIERGLRKLQCQQWTCEKGSNPDLIMTFAGRKWGSK